MIRVMSDGAPKWATSRPEKPVTWWKRLPRTSRPKPMAALEPKYTAADGEDDLDEGDDEHDAPTRQM